jgi:hypothetical protein
MSPEVQVKPSVVDQPELLAAGILSLILSLILILLLLPRLHLPL